MKQDFKEQIAQMANQLKDTNIEIAKDKFEDLKKNVEVIMANSINSLIEKFQMQLTNSLNKIIELIEKENNKEDDVSNLS